MPESEIAFVLYRPHDAQALGWKHFRQNDCPGVTYKMITNPMGRAPPDDKTHFVIHTLNPQRLEEGEDVCTKFDTDLADTEMRIYTPLQIFDPLNLGAPTTTSPLLLQAEATPADIGEFQHFYQVDHTVMMAKHPGYRRTILYELRSVLKPAQPAKDVAPVLILHEFETFEEVGGPVTQASIVTPLAQKVFGSVKSMISRGLQLDSMSGSR